jgi:hypothetical protein
MKPANDKPRSLCPSSSIPWSSSACCLKTNCYRAKTELPKRLTKARFRFRADLEDLDLTFHKDLTKAKIKELCELSFLHNQENLLILGKSD